MLRMLAAFMGGSGVGAVAYANRARFRAQNKPVVSVVRMSGVIAANYGRGRSPSPFGQSNINLKNFERTLE